MIMRGDFADGDGFKRTTQKTGITRNIKQSTRCFSGSPLYIPILTTLDLYD